MSKKVPLAEATNKQMKAFAKDVLGLPVSAVISNADLRALIAAAHDKPDITVADDDAPESEAPPAASARARLDPSQASKVRVQILVTEGPGGNDPVPLGVNGKINLYQRGVDHDMDPAYFEVLKNAVIHVHDPVRDKDGIDRGYNPKPRAVPMYPYQVLGLVPA